jgi:glyoxylase-like metal-dependent hydrolase (beta-lactamase superfamily II)
MVDQTKVHILHCGNLSCDLTWLVLKPGVTIAPRTNTDMGRPWVQIPTMAILVEHPEGNLLFDNSCPRDWEQRWAGPGFNDVFPYDGVDENSFFDSRLKQLGMTPADIDVNVISHLHFDHAANTKMLKDAGARIVVSDTEKDFAFGFEGEAEGAHLKADYDGVEMETISGDTEIFSGVTMLQTPGHTAGCMSMQVDLPDSGTMLFTSDAVYLSDSWGPPPAGAALVWDNRAWLRSVEKLRGIAEQTNATLVFGHDPEQHKSLKTAPDGFYT